MSEEVLWRGSIAGLRDWIQDQYKEQLQAVRDQYLPLIFENHMVVGYAPCCRIVFEGLYLLVVVIYDQTQNLPCSTSSRAPIGLLAFQGK